MITMGKSICQIWVNAEIMLFSIPLESIVTFENEFRCVQTPKAFLNPYLTNGFSHRYQLGESTSINRGVRCDFKILFHFSMKFLCANRIAPDGTPRSAASDLVLFCLPMSHKRDARLK